MNNKSDKKHKPKPKPKLKHKKKTASLQSKKKKEIKSGGAFSSIKSFFSKNKSVESNNKIELQPLLPKNMASSASINPQKTHSTNITLQIQNIQPNAQPQGFNTIKSTSRCSIL